MFALTSPAFLSGTRIPKDFTQEGSNQSPPLTWRDPPEGTQEYALICEDPDAPLAGSWVHWVLYNVPREILALDAGNVDGGTVGVNSLGNRGYTGPMPPLRHGTHRYHFTLYALDTKLRLPPARSRTELQEALSGHVLAVSVLIGTYDR